MVFFSSWWYNWWYGVNKLGAVNAYATTLPAKGPYDSVQLGMLKQLDKMVNELEKSSGTQVHLTMLLRERAMSALPDNTAALLQGNMMSSEIALELVRRDMTEYSQLSSGLAGSTPEDLENDPVLKKIHDRLSMAVELHGLLTLAGITPTEREWAQSLADTFVDLRSLRATPWSEVAWLLGLVEIAVPEKGEEEEEEADTDSSVPEGLKNFFDNPPTNTELRMIQELYSFGDGAPAIRGQVLAFRMDLDVADELESMGIYDASQMTANDQRRLLLNAEKRVEEAEAAEKAKQDLEEEKQAKAMEEAKKKVASGGAGNVGETGTTPTPAPASEPPTAQPLVAAEPDFKPRALPAFAAIASKVLPVAAKVLPKLAKGSKLTSAIGGGKGGLSSLGKNLSAMKANASNPGSSGKAGAKSGLVPSRVSQVGAKLDEVSSTVDSATGVVESVKGFVTALSPDVEAEVAAIEQEKARLQKSLDKVQSELEKVDVGDTLKESLATAQAALDKAKAQVAPDPNFGARIAAGSSQALQQSLSDQRLSFGGPVGLGSYASNEELVSKASGGFAMYGMNFFPTDEDIVLKPYSPILQPPSFVEMAGAVSPFEARVEKTTSETRAAAFHSTSSHAGISVAETVTTTKGKSKSGSKGVFGIGKSKSGSESTGTVNESNQGQANEETNENTETSSTSSATLIEYIRCPMKSFRIPVSQMSLSADAYAAAIEVDSIEKGEEFLDNFGSHVSAGRHELGGIFFTTITLTSEKAQSTVKMMSAASKTSEEIKSTSALKESGGKSNFVVAGSKSANSFGRSTSTGVAVVTGNADTQVDDESRETAQYESYVRCVGPNTPTPEAFAEALFTDTSTWAVTDRGRLEAMVPVTKLLLKAASLPGTGTDDFLKKKLEIATLFVKAAWRRRAKFWGFLLQDRVDLDVPTPVVNLVKSAFPSSLGRVPTLLKALTDSLIIRHTGLTFDPTNLSQEADFQLEVRDLAAMIVEATTEGSLSSNSFPVELPFLDAAGVEKQVIEEIKALSKKNPAGFNAVLKETSFEPAEGIDSENIGSEDDLGVFWDDATEGDPKPEELLWAGLEDWQKKWIHQTIRLGGVWTPGEYELFQRLYFTTTQNNDFVEHLAKLIKLAYPTEDVPEPGAASFSKYMWINMSKKEAKQEALQRAASGMLRADWKVVAELWIEDEKATVLDDALGPEGDSLWTRVLNGVGLFEKLGAMADFVGDDPGTVKDRYDTKMAQLELEALGWTVFTDLHFLGSTTKEDGKYLWNDPVPSKFAEGKFGLKGDDEGDAADELVVDAYDRLEATYDFLVYPTGPEPSRVRHQAKKREAVNAVTAWKEAYQAFERYNREFPLE